MPIQLNFNREDALQRVRHSEVQGVSILDMDFSHASPQETLVMLEEFQRSLAAAAPNSVRILSSVAEMTYDPAVSSKWKAIRVQYDPSVRASAVYGCSGLLNVAVRSYTELMAWLKLPRAQSKIRIFEDRDEALSWLIKV